MRVNSNSETSQDQETADSYLGYSSESSPLGHKAYHELADFPVVESDVLAQLHTNLEMLGNLQERLSFVMREIRYLMKV
ncbi:MAG: hypothetical protein ACXVCY_03910 [Pseudobdellovibrionaceae bacterium]